MESSLQIRTFSPHRPAWKSPGQRAQSKGAAGLEAAGGSRQDRRRRSAREAPTTTRCALHTGPPLDGAGSRAGVAGAHRSPTRPSPSLSPVPDGGLEMALGLRVVPAIDPKAVAEGRILRGTVHTVVLTVAHEPAPRRLRGLEVAVKLLGRRGKTPSPAAGPCRAPRRRGRGGRAPSPHGCGRLLPSSRAAPSPGPSRSRAGPLHRRRRGRGGRAAELPSRRGWPDRTRDPQSTLDIARSNIYLDTVQCQPILPAISRGPVLLCIGHDGSAWRPGGDRDARAAARDCSRRAIAQRGGESGGVFPGLPVAAPPGAPRPQGPARGTTPRGPRPLAGGLLPAARRGDRGSRCRARWSSRS